MPFSLVLDLLVAILLVVTILYAVVLSRKLNALRNDRAELEVLATSFAQATVRAEESIGRLKGAVGELQGGTERAQGLRDDLAFLVERGSTIADRLEEMVREARNQGVETVRPPSQTSQKNPAQNPAQQAKSPLKGTKHADLEEEARTDAERELLKALRSAR